MLVYTLLGLIGTSIADLAVLPLCATPPSTRGEVYVVRDTTSKSYAANKYLAEIHNAMKRVEGFFSQTDYFLTASVGLAHHMYTQNCFNWKLTHGALWEVANQLDSSYYSSVLSENFEATHVIYALFLQQGMWNKAAGPSYRRLYLIITSQRPVSISTSVEKKLEDKNIMLNNCPIDKGQMGGWQFGKIMAQMETGLGVFLVENAKADYVSAWQSYIGEGDLTDAIVYGAHTTFGMDWDLYQLISSLYCPSWIATTSTTTVAPPSTPAPTSTLPCTQTSTNPPLYHEDSIYECLMDLSRCSTDLEYMTAHLAKCLNG